ncbi:MAG TPA: hypothetical protein VFD36_20445 [Kofleriaceae bacterium]|nr:hypothetical protein [Kofleriaceae bacterium]
MPQKPDKQSLLKVADTAKLVREEAEAKVLDLAAQLEAARQAQTDAEAAHEAAHAEAYAEEIAAAAAEAKANHERHEKDGARIAAQLKVKREAREKAGVPLDHTAIEVFTVDGKTHQVIAAHGLALGHAGFAGGERRDGSRYKAACGLSVDAPHDELDHARFDKKPADCPKCAQAIADMDAGKIPDQRSEYLTGEEQLAHARRVNKERNAKSSELAEVLNARFAADAAIRVTPDPVEPVE